MTELIRNAWLGWGRFTQNGKLAALFLAVLLFLWLSQKKVRHKAFVLYATLAAVCCMVPVTAAFLMLYQTKFYDYEWVWSLVPLTAVTAYGLAGFLTEYWKDFKGSLWKKGLPVALLLAGVLAVCSGMGRQPWSPGQQAQERRQVQALIGELREQCGNEQICLWAPENVMEYVREIDGGIRLAYGRNMWESSLNAYAYDTYDQSVTGLYQWMEQASGAGQKESVTVTASQCGDTVKSMGINCILLPETAAEERVAELEAVLGVTAGRLGSYYLFLMRVCDG